MVSRNREPSSADASPATALASNSIDAATTKARYKSSPFPESRYRTTGALIYVSYCRSSCGKSSVDLVCAARKVGRRERRFLVFDSLLMGVLLESCSDSMTCLLFKQYPQSFRCRLFAIAT